MKKFFKRFYLAFILLFLYAPILTLIVFSFNESKLMASWTGFSFKWYEKLFSDPNILKIIWITLSVAVLSAVIATIIGTLAAIGIHQYKKFTKNLIINISYIPMVNADIVTGVSLLLFFIFVKMDRGYMTLLLAHITFNIPYVIFSVLPKLKQMNPELYDAALDLGATPAYATRKVILPEIMPGVITGFILSFTLSFDDFIISFFVTQGLTQNLSIYIYSMARKGINPSINALSAIMFVLVITLLIIINIRSNITAKKQSELRKETY